MQPLTNPFDTCQCCQGRPGHWTGSEYTCDECRGLERAAVQRFNVHQAALFTFLDGLAPHEV